MRIVDIDKLHCRNRPFKLLILDIINVLQCTLFIVSNGHYLLISTIRIADINNAIC